jgi:BlaI family transcriptional regulator, penicillinase repressor
MRKTAPLTPAEFELMEVLWELGDGSVRDVWERVRNRRNVAYTTVMTILDKMRRKQVLACRRSGKAYFYQPLLDRKQALDLVLREIVEDYFHGSVVDLRRHFDNASASSAPTSAQSRAAPESAHRMDEFLL